MRREVVTSALLISPITGVMPLPPAKKSSGRELSCSTKRPSGGSTRSAAPALTCSWNQPEPRPSGTRLTVTFAASPSSGALASE